MPFVSAVYIHFWGILTDSCDFINLKGVFTLAYNTFITPACKVR